MSAGLVTMTGIAALALVVGCAGLDKRPQDLVDPAPGSYDLRPWNSEASLPTTAADNAARPGRVKPDPATPHTLSLRWPIQGDANGNAVVKVAYRQTGEQAWREGLPLFWVHPKTAPEHLRVPRGRLFAGSIVELRPATAYEVRLNLMDPDGGSLTRRLSLRTGQEPIEPTGLRVVHAVPGAPGARGPGSGTEADPFLGLEPAFAHASPGDVILLRPGIYRGANLRIERSGASGRPIIIRGAPGGAVVLDGGGQETLIDVSGQEYIWFEHLTFRNATTLLKARRARYMVIRHNRFEVRNQNLAVGIEARGALDDETSGFFITDNVFDGPNAWPRAGSRKTDAERIFGIAITGAGHVIAYNRMGRLGDAINNGRGGYMSASDIHNNDIFDATDDCIEADHSTTNLRVFRNRLTNCFAGVSAQPIHGGPAYVFRNLILNAQYSPFKLHNHTSGLLLFHNTSVKAGIPFKIQPAHQTVNDVITRNNIFIGTSGPAIFSTGRMIRCDFDNDGYGWYSGGFALWNDVRYRSPAFTSAARGLYGRFGVVELSPGSTFSSGLGPPYNGDHSLDPAANDPWLDPESGAVDQGVVLPNFADRFAGKRPDLGCCELGAPLPHFGPRPAAGS